MTPKDLIKLRPNELTIKSRYQTRIESLEDSEDIIILCLNVDMNETNQLSIYSIESFEDEFQFIARVLSIKDKTIYVIISTVMGKYVIPMIDKHYCIERFYLYDSTNSKSSTDWSMISEKIDGLFSHLEHLREQIAGHIKTAVKRPLLWDRSTGLFLLLHTQQLQINRCSSIEVSNDKPRDEHIVIFRCNNPILIQVKQCSSPLTQFIDEKKCTDFIEKQSNSQIFLVISGGMTTSEIDSIFSFQQIYAIYFFQQNEFKFPNNKRKISGFFYTWEDLDEQLYKDILFFREQRFHTLQIDICSEFEQDKPFIPQLEPNQMSFLTVQLLVDILPEIAPLETTSNGFKEQLKALATKTEFKRQPRLNLAPFDTAIEQGNWFEKNVEVLQIILRFHQLDMLTHRLILQKQLANIQKRILESSEIHKPFTVYLTKIISSTTLDTLKKKKPNCGGFIHIGILVLATKSLLTARSIARQAANNGLISVLFEIDVVEGTRLMNINNDHVVFYLGSVFRLESVNLAPDGVRYIKIKCANVEFRLIKDQLQRELGIQLSWLTYGNYLPTLNRFEQGEDYFKYLLEKLPLKHIDRPSIYNNMGLMYTMQNREHQANHFYNLALDCVKSISPDAAINERADLFYNTISTANIILSKPVIGYSTVLGNIADIHYKTNNHAKALEFYKKAFESATNQLYRYYYHQRILILSKSITDDPIDISAEPKFLDDCVSTVKATDKQTFIGMWFHDNSLSNDQQDKMRLYLNRLFYYYRIFDNMMEFSRYIDRRQLFSKIFLIVSDVTLYPALVKLVHKKQEIFEKVYVLAVENHTTDITMGCFKTSCAKALFEEVCKDISQYTIEKNSLNIVGNTTSVDPDIISSSQSKRIPSFVIIPDLNCRQITSIQHSTRESLKFLSFQVIIDIICGTSYNSTDLSEMWKTCHYLCMEDEVQLNLIEKLKINYQANEVINYYTEHSYLSRLLNQAFHTRNMKQIFEFRVYISDLYKKLEELDGQQEIDGTKSSINRIYFGTTLSESVLQQLIDNEGGLILFNGFLSTTLDFPVAFMSDGTKQVATENRSVLFQLQIDKKIKQPYAVISQYGTKSDELEILFSCGTIWRIDSVHLDEKPCIIKLASCDELASQLVELRKKYIQGNCTLMSLGDILYELREVDAAEWFYCRMLEQKSLDDKTCGHLYYKIGMIRYAKEIYLSALENLEKSARLLQSSYHKVTETMLPRPLYMYTNESVLLTVYNNMGFMFQKNGKYDEAAKRYQKALKGKGTDFELATVQNNLGLLYFERDDYTTSREHHLKAVELIDKCEFYWAEFRKNFDRVNQCSQYRTNEQTDNSQVTTFDKLNKSSDHDESHYEINMVPSTIIKLRPIKPDSEMEEVERNIKSITSTMSKTSLQHLKDNENIIILCLGVTLSDQTLFPRTTIEHLQDDLKFLARVLTTKDKTIFVVISTDMGDYVIPLIDKHYCIEKIYLFDDTNGQPPFPQWSLISEKINGPYPDLKQLCHQIVNDINMIREKLLCSDRSSDLFTMLYTQQMENRCSLTKISTDVSHDEYIVIFHCENQILFDAEQGSSPLNQFTDVDKCVQFINEHSQSQIFLVISGDMIPSGIQSVSDSQQIQAIYLFRAIELSPSINKKKLSGLFNQTEELADRLEKDIAFFRQQHIHTTPIDICPNFDREKELISQLNPQQMSFLTLQLFIDILPELPSLHTNDEQRNSVEQNFDLLPMVVRLHQINKVDDLFILHNQLADIQKRILGSPKLLKPITVYLAKIVSNDTLKMIQSNSDGYLNIGVYLLTTKSLCTVRTIAREAANNDLVSVLFEIEVSKGTYVQTVSVEQVILRLGSVFRFISSNLAPDGVWYVKIQSVNKDLQLIKEQLQLEVGIRLSWLTYGNYLSFLNHFEQGKYYFQYLLDKCSLEHIDRFSIYNNMGLIYTINSRGEIANHFYNLALDCIKSISPNAFTNEREDLSDMTIPTTNMILPKALTDHSTVLGNIGDVYYKRNNRTKALEFYKEAFASTTDQHRCRYYQQKILALSKT